jgi:dynein light chain LC8-type
VIWLRELIETILKLFLTSKHDLTFYGRLNNTMADSKVTVKSVDMSDEMLDDVKKLAKDSFQQSEGKTVVCRDVASTIKKECDKRFGGTWHCIVGKDFGSFVSHESKHFVYFYLNDYAILLFRAGL